MKRIGNAVIAGLAVWCLPHLLNLGNNHLAVTYSWLGVFLWGVLWYVLEKAETVKTVEAVKKESTCWKAAWLPGLAFSLCLAFGSSLDQIGSIDLTNPGMWLAILVWGWIFRLWTAAAWSRIGEWQDGKVQKSCLWDESSGLPVRKNGRIPEMKQSEKNCGHLFRESGEPEENKEYPSGETGRMGEKTESPVGLIGGTKYSNNTKNSLWLISRWEGLSRGKQLMVTACLLFVCWLPVFLAVYPGFFVYDAQDELLQVQTRRFTEHHPLPHVILLGGMILAVNKLAGSYNAGIAAYTLFQMAVLACVFSYGLLYLKEKGIQRWLWLSAACYFAFFPVIVMFSLCSAKDGIFSAALLILLVTLLEAGKDPEGFWRDRKAVLTLLISAVVMMSFRHNGSYAFLVLVPVILWRAKKCRKRAGTVLAFIFCLWYVLNTGLAGLLQAVPSGKQELLTVPIQQLARVWTYDREELSEEQLDTLYEILPEEALKRYRPKLSDSVKSDFRNEVFLEAPGRYVKLWLELFLEHPVTYLNGWLMTSYGFWYPDTVIDVYRGNTVFTYTYEDSSFFGYEVEQPGIRESKLPWLAEFYRKLSLEVWHHKIPVVSMLFSPGFLFWYYVFAAGYAYTRKKAEWLLFFAMLFLVWLTVLLGPTFLPRYVLILWFALPFSGLVFAEETDGAAGV